VVRSTVFDGTMHLAMVDLEIRLHELEEVAVISSTPSLSSSPAEVTNNFSRWFLLTFEI
jgi:hypothetical protein